MIFEIFATPLMVFHMGFKFCYKKHWFFCFFHRNLWKITWFMWNFRFCYKNLLFFNVFFEFPWKSIDFCWIFNDFQAISMQNALKNYILCFLHWVMQFNCTLALLVLQEHDLSKRCYNEHVINFAVFDCVEIHGQI